MDYHKDIIGQIELHNVEGIKRCFENGVSPNHLFRNEPLINELTSEYLRGPRFKKCVKVFVDFGLKDYDQVLLSVLLDDNKALLSAIELDNSIVHKRYTLRSTYTPLDRVTLLHICAEFNHVSCAEVLLQQGADVDAKARIDEHGFGGQTPIFHTVNQNMNQSKEMMNFLLKHGSDVSFIVKGIIWGKSYEWETLIPSVNPISYAMMGMLPQMHRNEKTISQIVTTLLHHQYGITYRPTNIPNKYLNS